MFELSTEDKKTTPPSLSVWAEELTIADQAWDFMGAKPKNTVVACLSADDVRAIPVPPQFQQVNVVWEQAKRDDGDGNLIPNLAPGAEGHCGIIGLAQGGTADKNHRKALRLDLAEAAKISPVPVPHDFDEDHVRIAAYFLYQTTHLNGTAETHWVSAIRQLRRHRVRLDGMAQD
ncbi:MAG: hypothetical protein SH850_20605 [Planctomycetaceae bacterium]|nr:hypothetical protein [Planctomycetaceae bacterium]